MSKKLRKSDAKADVPSEFTFQSFQKFSSLLKLHPRIPENDLPSFLTAYVVVHFAGEVELIHDVARFFFVMFTPYVDRNMAFPSLRLGETLAILTPDRKTVVAVLTFVECSGDVVIFFLATLPLFQGTGMGWFLLSLLYDTVYKRSTKANSSNSSITFYLKVFRRTWI
jgi:hypothetical protein